jgi:hypothetical protein
MEHSMAFNENLAQRIRTEIGVVPGYAEKKMFGGIAFLFQGNMACGIIGDDLIVRVGAANHRSAMSRPHVRQFDMTGRPMSGWVQVEAAGVAGDAALHDWIMQGVTFALSLPAK